LIADGTETHQTAPGASRPGPNRRQRFSKGHRPFFMKDPDVDRLLAIVTALTAEVAVVRERLDTTERLAALGLPATAANIEAYQPDPEVEAAREAVRAAMLDRVFRILAIRGEDEGLYETYATIVDQFA
jgi:hypothetical protein